VIIVEGPDGSGKTTLVNQLCRDLQLKKSGFSSLSKGTRDRVLPDDPRTRVYNAMAHAVGGQAVEIHDRLFWSEEIYGMMLRGGSKFSRIEAWRVEDILLAMKVPIIWCAVPWEVAKENLAGNEPQLDGWDWSHGFQIHESYLLKGVQLYKREGGVLLYDYTKDEHLNYDEVLDYIKRYLQARRSWTIGYGGEE
jgi:hypothetical protein